MALFLRDVKQAWRAVRSYAWSSALAIALLALAIGANGTIFTLINAVMLQPLPVHEPDRLVSFGQPRFSYRRYEELRHRVDAFDPLFAWSPQTVAIGSTGRTDSASALVVSGEFLSGLGVGAAVGRPLLEADDAAQSGSGEDGEVAVLGYDAWTRRFSADPAPVGETIRIETSRSRSSGSRRADFTVSPPVSIPTSIFLLGASRAHAPTSPTPYCGRLPMHGCT